MHDTILTQLIKAIPPVRKGLHVLDLGSGKNNWSLQLAEYGYRMTAVDVLPQNVFHAGITYFQSDVIEYLQSLEDHVMFDGILMRYILNYFSKETVREVIAPLLRKHLNPGGVIAVEELFQNAVPPFERDRTFWSADELWELFPDMKVVHEEMGTESGLDMYGNPRLLFKTQFVVRSEMANETAAIETKTGEGYTRVQLNA